MTHPLPLSKIIVNINGLNIWIYNIKMLRKMDRMIEILKANIDDLVAQMNENDIMYQTNVEDLKRENEKLRTTVMDLEQELEFSTKRMEELILKNTNLMVEVDELKKPIDHTTHPNYKKWLKFF